MGGFAEAYDLLLVRRGFTVKLESESIFAGKGSQSSILEIKAIEGQTLFMAIEILFRRKH